MRTFLELYLIFFTLKTFVVVGNAHPLTDLHKEDISKSNIKIRSLSTPVSFTTASITRMPYTCVYIPPDLDRCDFVDYKSNENLPNLAHKLSENEKHKLLKSNTKVYSPYLTTRLPKTRKVLRSTKIIIYEIQRCVPSRLPFNLPWCTEEDFSNKKSEIRQLYPFASDVSEATYEFPTRDLLNAI